jgi:hypothetical protein
MSYPNIAISSENLTPLDQYCCVVGWLTIAPTAPQGNSITSNLKWFHLQEKEGMEVHQVHVLYKQNVTCDTYT